MASKSSPPEPGKPVKLSKSYVDLINAPGTYPDTEVTGFRLWVGKGGVKSYQVVGKVKGQPKTVFVTIGKHGDPWTPDAARQEAEMLRLLMRQGVNPNQQTREKRAEADAARANEDAQRKIKELTVSVAFHQLLEQNQKDNTVRAYKLLVGKHFKDWLNTPIVDITQDQVIKRFDKINSEAPGSAAHVMRILRAVFRTAQIRHGEAVPELANLNPVKILTISRKGWNSLEPRNEFIHDEDLPSFYKAVMGLSSKVAQDYLMVCILTGLRKNEVCTLTWSNIDLHKKTITISSSQAKNKQRHVLAMSDYLYDLFLRRWQDRDSDYVFPGRSAAGHFSDPEKPIKQVIEAAKIQPFTSHSLRRTFATAADALGYDLQKIQRLLNHKPSSVAERHYIQQQAEKTKEPMQRINDRLLSLMRAEEPKQPETTNVIPLSKASNG